MIKTVIFTGSEQQVQENIDEFWKKHNGVAIQFLAQSSSECFVLGNDCWSLTVVLTIRIAT